LKSPWVKSSEENRAAKAMLAVAPRVAARAHLGVRADG